MNIRDGQAVSLEEVLDNREMRVMRIQDLKQQYPNSSILSYKLNIPGPVKNNEMIQFIFNEGLRSLNVEPIKIELNAITGPEAFFISSLSAHELKEKCLDIEQHHPLGRLFDLDVDSVKRHDLNVSPRKCLICDQEAFVCSRSRAHSVDELLIAIENIVHFNYTE